MRSRMTIREVLVVDDERHIVTLLTELLEAEGYRVRQANDGIAALREIDQRRPDLVLTDDMMPRLGGLELARRMVALNIPTIVMSAAIVQARDPSLVFLPKPLNVDDLIRVVGTLLASAHGRSGTPRS